MSDHLSPVREWRIHLGAHKTATTHIQRTLAAHRHALLARDLDFIPMEEFRGMVGPFKKPRSFRRRLQWRVRSALPGQESFDTAMDALRRGPSTVLISDEDILGYSQDLLTVPFYQHTPSLHLVKRLAARGQTTTLFLGIRSLDGVLPSAYAQALRVDPYLSGRLERICRDWTRKPPSWVDLIHRIRAAVPEAKLRIWRYEDYRAHWRDLIAEYAGTDVGILPDVPPVQRTASPGPAAVAAAERLDPFLTQRARIARVREIYAAYPAGDRNGRFDPLSAADKARLRACYAEDLEAIAARWPGMLIVPEAEKIPTAVRSA